MKFKMHIKLIQLLALISPLFDASAMNIKPRVDNECIRQCHRDKPTNMRKCYKLEDAKHRDKCLDDAERIFDLCLPTCVSK